MSIVQYHKGTKCRSDLNWCEPKVEMPHIRNRGFGGWLWAFFVEICEIIDVFCRKLDDFNRFQGFL